MTVIGGFGLHPYALWCAVEWLSGLNAAGSINASAGGDREAPLEAAHDPTANLDRRADDGRNCGDCRK
jgi:hypothetical protein